MPTEPPNAEPPKRKRPWVQFRMPTPIEIVLAIVAFGTLGGAIIYQLHMDEAAERAVQRNNESNKSRVSAERFNSSVIVGFVPSSVESLFCVDSRFSIKDQTDLSVASTFEVAEFFTTQLAAHTFASLNLDIGSVDCAVGACEAIKAPASDPKTGVSVGAFRSHRCEVLLLSTNLPADWLAALSKRPSADHISIAGNNAISLNLDAGRVLIANPAPNLLCIANDAGLLSKVVELHNLASKDRKDSIDGNPTFRAAAALVSQPGGFWGVRLFGRSNVAADITSVRSPKSVLGFFDPEGAFAAIKVETPDAKDVGVYYASNDADKATEFANSRSRIIKDRKVIPRMADAGSTSPTIIYLNCQAASPELPLPLIFVGFAAFFGQGVLL